MLFDSHAHLTSAHVLPKLDEMLPRAREGGVDRIVNICTDRPSLEAGIELAKKHSWIYNAGATTPHDVEKEGEELFPLFAEHARNGDFVAVGETGLDYFYNHSDRAVQRDFFVRYLKLARETQLPIIIHCREAFDDFFEILDAEYMQDGRHLPGVLHCFTGTLAEAEEVIKRGWYLSLSGIVTFKKSEELRDVARMVPLDQLFIETDTPYLAPQKYRGKTNEPAYVAETATLIADVKDISRDELAKATHHNASSFFGLSTAS